jgi:hypothetical protein
VHVEEFVGIVRGRTAASSRAVPTPKTAPSKSDKPKKAVPTKGRTPQRARPRKSRGR